ncbi:beta-lactamase family protein [Brachybacterium halotolerans subsp. kimchii]|uniref:serine hydrolase domain-containing protein n=1 Tax=Brachybacterium halotolerans TaxID=2795215 RepID=UPI001E3BBEF2|nr:serine hydrolase domain-containing protein [Brachybacterium halotolerans]UEJ81799.1 beta-lactamase family protein [Brachybacterium halotolerans subsp. kimchii]
MPADTAEELESLLDSARSEGQFSAASWAVGSSTRTLGSGVLGTPSESDEVGIGPRTLFDLASVTKPIVGLTLLRLVGRGLVALDTTVGEVLLDWPDGPMAHADLRSLLTHASGAPGPTPLFREHGDRESLLHALARLEFTAPGQWCYSSMGFIALGLVAERVGGAGLDDLVHREITGPLGMRDTRYGPVDRGDAVATEACPWRGRLVRGTVHDENAEVLGGVAGHAGLFGTAEDLGRLGAALLRGSLLEPALQDAMTGRRDGRPLGWWPRERCSFLDGTFDESAYGHTGFTGTSLVIDPSRDRWFCLLTNRVHPTREPRGFERVRADFHAVASRGAWGIEGSPASDR